MAYCKNDYNEQCFGECRNCNRFYLKCVHCGVRDELYDLCGEIICFDCIRKNMGSDYLYDFAGEYSSLFDNYLRELFEYDMITE